jgi:PEP-CTERM motif
MSYKTLIPLAVAAIAAASPAYADVTPTNDPCTYGYVTGAIACQGYYGGNLITGTTGSATTAAENNAINLLLTNAVSQGPGYTPPYGGLDYDTVLGAVTDLNGSATLDFGSLNLSGLTILGAHFGNNIDSDPNNITAFWLLDLGSTTTHTITLSNGQGSSNAQIFATGVASVPEPATWAMMLVGFFGVGAAMRRPRRKAALMQVA